jgi:isoleucyl-tRNA synthetase
VHYPFENAEWFEHHFPADFIVEYIGQTRGWFYMLHILSTALFDRPAFSSVICHGIVLGSDGQKMSKSLRNYPDVREVFDRDGADAMRWFLMGSPILRGGNLIVTEQGIRDGVRQVIIPLWNTWYFFSLYANAFGGAGGAGGSGSGGYEAKWSTGSTDPLDRYLLAKLRQFVETMTTQLDGYEVASACETTRGFLDVLTNWYVRRSRERFWDTGSADGSGGAAQAFDTLYTALEVLCRVTAPLLPLVTEEIWRGLTGGRSVHLTDWPEASDLPADDALVAAMDRVRDVCSVASSLRKADGLRTRLPLGELTVVVADAAALQPFAPIIADEVNVKRVTLIDEGDSAAAGFAVDQRLTVHARVAGPRLGREVQKVIQASKSGDWSVDEAGVVQAGGMVLQDGEYTLEQAFLGEKDDRHSRALLPNGGGVVVLDTLVTPELAQEGLARDIVRAVQQARRDGGLDVSDRISLTVTGSQAVWEATVAHQALIVEETLASQFGSAPQLEALPERADVVGATVGDGEPVRIKVMKL